MGSGRFFGGGDIRIEFLRFKGVGVVRGRVFWVGGGWYRFCSG